VDPQVAAAEAIRLYDLSGDGRLNREELTACPAMSNVQERYDTDGDGHLSHGEIAARLEQLYTGRIGLLAVQCSVTRQGQPLAGARVRFVPEPFLATAIDSAVATTDSNGSASPSIPDDRLPASLRDLGMMQVGIYRVEVEHPALIGEEIKLLGFEVDPTRRDGTTVRFDL
jgi:hypothetical protein